MSELKRTQETWRGCDPKAMSVMSPAAIFYALTDAKHDIVKLHCELAALREELARVTTLAADNLEAWMTTKHSLAASEQRNAVLVAAIERIRFRCESFYDEADGMKKHSVRTMFDIATRALKPAEPGASE